jgi:hypothetical protein
VELCIAQVGEGCFTTFHSHFQDKSLQMRVKIARRSIGNLAKLIGLTLTSQLTSDPGIAQPPITKSPAPHTSVPDTFKAIYALRSHPREVHPRRKCTLESLSGFHPPQAEDTSFSTSTSTCLIAPHPSL